MNKNNIKARETYYYANRAIEVIRVVNQFHMARIRIQDTIEELTVDINAISLTPVVEQSISLKWLGGD